VGEGRGEGTIPHPTTPQTPSHNHHPADLLLSLICKQTVIFLSFEHVMLPREHKTRDIAHPAQ
ncbi:hypothetical protein M9Y48_16760, partial [Enterobacter cloacae subsp. cloacae]